MRYFHVETGALLHARDMNLRHEIQRKSEVAKRQVKCEMSEKIQILVLQTTIITLFTVTYSRSRGLTKYSFMILVERM